MTRTIIILVLILSSIGIFMKYISPKYDEVNVLKSKIARIEQALSKTRTIRRKRSALSEQAKNFSEENTARLNKLLPTHVDNVRLILDLDGIASQYGIRIKNVQVKKKEDLQKGDDSIIGSGGIDQRSYQSLIIQFDIVSTYPEFIAFIKDVEKSLRIVDIVALTMNPKAKNTANAIDGVVTEPEYKFTLALRTYWLNSN